MCWVINSWQLKIKSSISELNKQFCYTLLSLQMCPATQRAPWQSAQPSEKRGFWMGSSRISCQSWVHLWSPLFWHTALQSPVKWYKHKVFLWHCNHTIPGSLEGVKSQLFSFLGAPDPQSLPQYHSPGPDPDWCNRFCIWQVNIKHNC